MPLSPSKAREVKADIEKAVADQARVLGNPTPDTRAIEQAALDAVAAVDANPTVGAPAQTAKQDDFTENVASQLQKFGDIHQGPTVAKVTVDRKTGKVVRVERSNEQEWAHALEGPATRARRQRFKDLRSNIEWRHRIEMVVLGSDSPDVKAAKCEAIYQDSIRAFGDPERALFQRGI